MIRLDRNICFKTAITTFFIFLGGCVWSSAKQVPRENIYCLILEEFESDKDMYLLSNSEEQHPKVLEYLETMHFSGGEVVKLQQSALKDVGTSSCGANFQHVNINQIRDESKTDRDFRRKLNNLYPKAVGYVTFSPVIYTDSGHSATLVVSYYCDGLCGAYISLVSLNKISGDWEIVGVKILIRN